MATQNRYSKILRTPPQKPSEDSFTKTDTELVIDYASSEQLRIFRATLLLMSQRSRAITLARHHRGREVTTVLGVLFVVGWVWACWTGLAPKKVEAPPVAPPSPPDDEMPSWWKDYTPPFEKENAFYTADGRRKGFEEP